MTKRQEREQLLEHTANMILERIKWNHSEYTHKYMKEKDIAEIAIMLLKGMK